MKQLFLSAAILTVSLGLCIGANAYVARCASQTLDDVAQAQTFALRQEREQAERALAAAQQRWTAAVKWLEIFLPHDEADEISRMLASLGEYVQTPDADDFRSGCAEVCFLLEHMTRMQQLSIQNIL